MKIVSRLLVVGGVTATTLTGLATKVRADKTDDNEVSKTEGRSLLSGWLSLLVKNDNVRRPGGMVYAWGGGFGKKPVHLRALGDDISEVAVTKDCTGVSLSKSGHVTLFSYDKGVEINPRIVSFHSSMRATNIALKSDQGEVVLVDNSGNLHTTTLLPKLETMKSDQSSRQVIDRGSTPPTSGKSMSEPPLNPVILQNVNDQQVRTRVRSVKCGPRHCAALTFCGRVFSWGDDSHGQLGNQRELQGDPIASKKSNHRNECENKSITRIAREMRGPPEMSVIVDVACGENHTLLVDDNGNVYGCGSDSWTQLATSAHPWKPDHEARHYVLTDASLLRPMAVASVAAGTNHSFFLLRDGNLFSSGFNQFGQLAHHNYSSFAPPSPVADFSLRVKKVAAGGDATCIITEDQKVLCIGANSSGQLGNGSQQPSATWRKPSLGRKAANKPIYIYVGNESAAIIVTKNCAMNTIPS